jgi:hypothetical protein
LLEIVSTLLFEGTLKLFLIELNLLEVLVEYNIECLSLFNELLGLFDEIL